MNRSNVFDHARRFLSIFGYCTIKSFLNDAKCNELINELKRYAQNNQAYQGHMVDISMSAIAENDMTIAKYISTNKFAEIANGLLSDPIIWGSDGCIGQSNFQFHRDLFIDPSVYKFFIALSPGEFYVLPGTHIYGDKFARSAAICYSGWDKNNSEISTSFSELHVLKESQM